jgi:hypothetical protein
MHLQRLLPIRFLVLFIVFITLSIERQALAKPNYDFEGVWTTNNGDSHTTVLWNSKSNQYEGVMTKLGKVAKDCGVNVGDTILILIPSNLQEAVPASEEILRCNLDENGRLKKKEWLKGVVYPHLSTKDKIVTSNVVLRRLIWDASNPKCELSTYDKPKATSIFSETTSKILRILRLNAPGLNQGFYGVTISENALDAGWSPVINAIAQANYNNCIRSTN